ncbi:hypothetical protein LMG29542_08101 [Paraburkholderia humisilvae]|uniref:Uncharacterized protein n=1 Tax=Paraburkholderia humisilvae TaxID=627669 RepID=A0A6J5F8N0_9BURK|nr:hypothetical protein LMG29542_08101 [Paraburkholderia humisilvae]
MCARNSAGYGNDACPFRHSSFCSKGSVFAGQSHINLGACSGQHRQAIRVRARNFVLCRFECDHGEWQAHLAGRSAGGPIARVHQSSCYANQCAAFRWQLPVSQAARPTIISDRRAATRGQTSGVARARTHAAHLEITPRRQSAALAPASDRVKSQGRRGVTAYARTAVLPCHKSSTESENTTARHNW